MLPKIVRNTEIKPASACRYDAASLGEVMLRLDPGDVPTPRAREMRVYQGGGEANVASGLSYTFGLRTAVITALVEDEIGLNIRNQLREVGVDTGKIIWFNTRSGVVGGLPRNGSPGGKGIPQLEPDRHPVARRHQCRPDILGWGAV